MLCVVIATLMAQHTTRDSFSGPILYGPSATAIDPAEADLTWPFGDLVSLDREDIRETAYEVFYTACRSSPGFGGGRNAITFYSNHHHLHDAVDSGGSGSTSGSGSVSSNGGRVGGGSVVVTTPTSKIKRALGLKMLKRSPSRRMSSGASGGGGGGGVVGSTPGSPCSSTPSNHSGGYSPFSTLQTVPMSRPRRPLTSAEIMRLQMRVTEQSDNRLRKTLMRTLVGQVRNAVCIS